MYFLIVAMLICDWQTLQYSSQCISSAAGTSADCGVSSDTTTAVQGSLELNCVSASSRIVVSRLHMSDKQRLEKQRFEEKQREEARRLAQEEKLAKKKV